MSVSGEQLVSLLQAADQSLDQSDEIDDLSGSGGGGAATLPSEGFTVKTLDELGQKIFINICSSPLVPLPPSWPSSTPFSITASPLGSLITTYLTAPQNLKDSNSKKQAESALAIPMHLSSPPRSNVDHVGNTCTVLDCVINPQVLDATTQNRPFKMFLVQLALGQAEKILDRQLDPQFKLPKMRRKGELAPLDISLLENRSNTRLPSLLDDTLNESQQLEEERNLENGELRLPVDEPVRGPKEKFSSKKKVILIEKDQGMEAEIKPSTRTKLPFVGLPLPRVKYGVIYLGKPKATAAVITMHVPSSFNLDTLKKETLHITSGIDSVDVTLSGCAPVHVPLPMAVHADKAMAVLESEKKILTLTLPFASFQEVKEKWKSEISSPVVAI